MLDLNNINWLFFDFGGCLDSDGLHSRTLFLNSFLKHGIVTKDQSELFQDGYSYSDNKVITGGIIKSLSLQEMNIIMARYIVEFLNLPISDEIIQKLATDITAPQSAILRRNRYLIEKLSQKFHLGVISNFSGNLELILREFDLINFFEVICDSYYLGVCKPDQKIFKIALEKAGCLPSNAIYIGDNPEKDILPACQLGFQTVLITSGNKSSDYANACLASLPAFFEMIQNRYPMIIQSISTSR